MSAKRRAPRGFTLLELMIAGGLGVMVVAAAYGIFMAQTAALQGQTNKMAMQANSRAALSFIAAKAREAGFGVDPSFAFDFNVYKCGSPGTATPGCSPARDGGSTGSDELVFYSRDKNYHYDPDVTPVALYGHVWEVDSATGAGVLSIKRRGTAAKDSYVFYPGQILIAACPGAAAYTYVTVGAKTEPPASNGAQTIPLSSATNVSGDPTQRAADLSMACLVTGGRVMPIDRHRFFLKYFQPATTGSPSTTNPVTPSFANTTGGATANPPPNGTPYLLYDRGLDLNGDEDIDDKDAIVVAADVDDFQIAYLTINSVQINGPSPTTSFASLPSFASPPTAMACGDASTNFYDVFSLKLCVTTTPLPAERQTNIPANVTGLRISLVTRSQTGDSEVGDAQEILENHNSGLYFGDKRRRQVLSTTISANNMLSRSNFL